MGIYRGAGGTGDAVNDASSEASIVVVAKDAALAAQVAAEAAQAGAVVAEASAASSATSAATSATNAAASATTAVNAIATTQGAAAQASQAQVAAANSATAAATSATNAANSATSASSSATTAATSASTATTQAGIATTQASNASTSATSAASSATAAAASYDAFDDRYLGAKSTPPSVDNDGNALLTGALYYNTTGTPQLYIWDGSAWDEAAFNATGAVTSFNTRTGAVTLSSSDVTNALTYTPYNATNPSGYITNTTSNTFTANQVVSVTDNTNAALRITQLGTGNALLVEDSANPDATPFVVDANGKLVVGSTATVAIPSGDGGLYGAGIEALGAVGGTASLGAVLYNNAATGFGGALSLAKSNSATVGTQGLVTSGDLAGAIYFSASDGTNFIRSAQILANIDGTPGTNDMPGRLVFSTTADGASSPTERMRIDNAGRVGIGGTPSAGRTLTIQQNLSGSTSPFGLINAGSVQSDATGQASYYSTFASTAASSFTSAAVVHYQANQGTFGLGSTVTSQIGFNVSNNLTGATNNFGFRSEIPAATNRWNFYAGGTAANYFAGTTTVGTLTNTNSSTIVSGGTISETVGGVQHLVASQFDIGTAPNDIPLNQYLGTLAYQSFVPFTGTGSAAPTIASAATIAPTTPIIFVSGTTAIVNITPPATLVGGGQLTIIPTGVFTTTTAGNIALASTAVVSRALIMTWDATANKWYPSY